MLPFKTSIGLYTDYYELTMAQGHFLNNRHEERSCFDYFFRKNPYNGGFVVFAGLSSFIEMLQSFRFDEKDCEYLEQQGFDKNFINYLRNFEFKGNIHAVREGEIIFPYEPVLHVEGTILETQLIETLLLNILNFESLIATKACRCKLAAGDKTLMEFGLRRSQGFGGINASKAAIIGGFDATSNVYSASLYHLNSSGTMAHAWIQSFNDELKAFRTYAKHFPEDCVLLVDTYDTLKSGIPNAVIVARELEEKGYRLKGIRLDSGDLTYLSSKARKQLNKAGLEYVKIIASNQLDEYIIESLQIQGAPIDSFGVGTSLATGQEDAALDGVYKLSLFNGNPTIKISDNIAKMTLPGIKTVYRFFDEDGLFDADGIAFKDEGDFEIIHHPFETDKQKSIKGLKKEELLTKVMEGGNITYTSPSPYEIAEYVHSRLKQLPNEHKRFLNPHVYKVGITTNLMDERNNLAKQYLKKDF
ncbi:nicotinate phosphoribosyltransferase [Abyssalbus ytuae]|uniref:Nicotinate phosphoribosyltransferase n=1 Tax=Abyssalbus ytuae TaxID=2926907 RepID=A0A9E6ZXQ1_9FLAO|nr:nicotinate phosphoribosyltransferase [Abyssalbus ytuae]UOB18826.1 nicotinate phosphoribosyltransferase [Abyssalbus ytuae]